MTLSRGSTVFWKSARRTLPGAELPAIVPATVAVGLPWVAVCNTAAGWQRSERRRRPDGLVGKGLVGNLQPQLGWAAARARRAPGVYRRCPRNNNPPEIPWT